MAGLNSLSNQIFFPRQSRQKVCWRKIRSTHRMCWNAQVANGPNRCGAAQTGYAAWSDWILEFGLNWSFKKDNYHAYMMEDG